MRPEPIRSATTRRRRVLPAVAQATLLGLLGACASGPDTPTPDPISDAERTQNEETLLETQRLEAERIRKQRELPRLMLDLQTALQRYFEYRFDSGPPRNLERQEQMERYLGEVVEREYATLERTAHETTQPRNRSIALASLGFADVEAHPDVHNVLINGLYDENQDVLMHAVLGLMVLGDPRTPPGRLGKVILNRELAPAIRDNAALTLYQQQLITVDNRLEPILEIWHDVLEGELDEEPDVVTLTAVRGLGETRDDAHRPLIERYVAHPTPKVRMAVAVALGRIRSEDSLPILFMLLGPAESNQNVKLATRKALQELAPGTDRGYDVEGWQKVFDRK